MQEKLSKSQKDQQQFIEENAMLTVRNKSLMSQIETEKDEAEKLVSKAKKSAFESIKKAEEERDLALSDLRSRKNVCKDLENKFQTEKELLEQELDHMKQWESQYKQTEKQLQNEIKAIQEERKQDRNLIF